MRTIQHNQARSQGREEAIAEIEKILWEQKKEITAHRRTCPSLDEARKKDRVYSLPCPLCKVGMITWIEKEFIPKLMSMKKEKAKG